MILQINGNFTSSHGSLYKEKIRELQKLPIVEPKIILVGGSNVFTSINARRIEENLNQTVFNAGLYYGFGIRFYCEALQNIVHRGDTLIISPEYDNFFVPNFYLGDVELSRMILFEYQAGIFSLNWQQIVNLRMAVSETLLTVQKKLVFFIDDNSRNKSFRRVTKESLILKGIIDKNWDMIEMYKPNGNKQVIIEEVLKTNTIQYNVIDYLEKFVEKMKIKGVEIVFEPAPVRSKFYSSNYLQFNYLQIALDKSKLCFLSKINECLVDDTIINQVANHLIEKGVMDRTMRIIKRLVEYFQSRPK